MRFSVYDHEETKLFGVIRDEMMERRSGEPERVWQERVGQVEEWNRWRSKLMTAVFMNTIVREYGLDADHAGMFRLGYVMAVGPGFLKEAAQRYGKDSEVFGCLVEAYGAGATPTEMIGGGGGYCAVAGRGNR